LDIDHRTLSNATNFILEADRKYTSFEFSQSPLLSAWPAVSEAYRHIYPVGAIQHIARDISEHDFLAVNFEEFVNWFKQQQGRLRNFDQERRELPEPGLLPARPRDLNCSQRNGPDVEELKIPHHGWGHRALILIKNGFQTPGAAGIQNATLKEFCQANNEGHPERLDGSPWHEMAGRIRCFRQVLLGGDRWLILYATREPVQTGAEMLHFAHRIARTLSQDACVDPDIRLFAADFGIDMKPEP
jgi:hypothetical protein